MIIILAMLQQFHSLVMLQYNQDQYQVFLKNINIIYHPQMFVHGSCLIYVICVIYIQWCQRSLDHMNSITGGLIRSRNFLLFVSTWRNLRFLLLFFVFFYFGGRGWGPYYSTLFCVYCVVFNCIFCLRSVSCIQCCLCL